MKQHSTLGTPTSINVVPGWYPDPQVPGALRWHDGMRWTQYTTAPQDVRPHPSPYSIAAIVLGIVGFFLFPIVVGTIAVVLGGVALSKQEPRATIGMAVALVGLVGGLLLSVLVAIV